jgi:Phage tail protein
VPTQVFKFGDYDFSDNADGWSEATPQIIASTPVPRRAGGIASEGIPGTKRVTIRGSLIAADPAALRALEDQVLLSFRNTTGNETGPVNKLRVFDDRYVNAQLDSWQRDYGVGMTSLVFNAVFQSADPYWVSDTLNSQTTSPVVTSQVIVVSAHGSAPSPPSAIRVTATRGMAAGTRLSNLTANKWFQYGAFLATGDVLNVDAETLTVTKNGVTALTDFTGDFWVLVPGDNQLRYDAATTAGQLTFEWRDRYH